jgi:hypothetical protein
MSAFVAILAFSMLFLLFAMVLTGFTLFTFSLWLDLKDQLQERRKRRIQRTVRLDEGHVQRGNRSGAVYQPKPQIDPKGQSRTPNPPPSEP